MAGCVLPMRAGCGVEQGPGEAQVQAVCRRRRRQRGRPAFRRSPPNRHCRLLSCSVPPGLHDQVGAHQAHRGPEDGHLGAAQEDQGVYERQLPGQLVGAACFLPVASAASGPGQTATCLAHVQPLPSCRACSWAWRRRGAGFPLHIFTARPPDHPPSLAAGSSRCSMPWALRRRARPLAWAATAATSTRRRCVAGC